MMESPLHTTRALLSALRIARSSEWEGRGPAWWKVSLTGGLGGARESAGGHIRTLVSDLAAAWSRQAMTKREDSSFVGSPVSYVHSGRLD